MNQVIAYQAVRIFQRREYLVIMGNNILYCQLPLLKKTLILPTSGTPIQRFQCNPTLHTFRMPTPQKIIFLAYFVFFLFTLFIIGRYNQGFTTSGVCCWGLYTSAPSPAQPSLTAPVALADWRQATTNPALPYHNTGCQELNCLPGLAPVKVHPQSVRGAPPARVQCRIDPRQFDRNPYKRSNIMCMHEC
jgi:hypothetical protein